MKFPLCLLLAFCLCPLAFGEQLPTNTLEKLDLTKLASIHAAARRLQATDITFSVCLWDAADEKCTANPLLALKDSAKDATQKAAQMYIATQYECTQLKTEATCDADAMCDWSTDSESCDVDDATFVVALACKDSQAYQMSKCLSYTSATCTKDSKCALSTTVVPETSTCVATFAKDYTEDQYAEWLVKVAALDSSVVGSCDSVTAAKSLVCSSDAEDCDLETNLVKAINTKTYTAAVSTCASKTETTCQTETTTVSSDTVTKKANGASSTAISVFGLAAAAVFSLLTFFYM